MRIACYVGAALGVAIVIAIPSLVGAYRATRDGEASLRAAAEAVRRQDAPAARSHAERARTRLTDADESLSSIWATPARFVPVLRRQILAAEGVARAGSLLAESGTIGADAVGHAPEGGWALRGGRLDTASLGEAGATLRRAVPLAERATTVIEQAPGSWLVGPLADARRRTVDAAERATETFTKAAAGLEAAPAFLGSSGPRRYLVINANPTELRGTGGLMGFFALIEADRGSLRALETSGRPATELWPLGESGIDQPEWFDETWGSYLPTKVWQNINVSGDFPAVGHTIVQALRGEPGPVDGVVQVDPDGLSALLRLAGPVTVDGWDGAIDADNVVPFALREQYVRFADNAQRDAFGARLMKAVFGRMLSGDVPLSADALDALGGTVASGSVKVYASDPAVQSAMATLGVDGGLQHAADSSDVLGLYHHNAGENKVDLFMEREVRYDVELDPNTRRAVGRLRVKISNRTPPDGVPAYMLGNQLPGLERGDNKTVLVLLRPPGSELLDIRVDGVGRTPTIGSDGPLRAYLLPMVVPVGKTSIVDVLVSSAWEPGAEVGDRYNLTVLGQSSFVDDDWSISVDGEHTYRGPLATHRLVLNARPIS